MEHVLLLTDTYFEKYEQQLRAVDATLDVVLIEATGVPTQADLDRVTVAFFSDDAWPDRARSFMAASLKSPNLTWFHTMSAGTDAPVFAMLIDRGVRLSTSIGTASSSIAQTVMMYLLALTRDLPELMRAQSRREWLVLRRRDLADVRVGIVGLGSIGTEVARLLLAFGSMPIGLRRTVRGDEICETWETGRLHELAASVDALVVTAPLTDETRGLIDAGVIAAMPAGALFVNVGRGEIVDEPALLGALESGHLGGAGLDVFQTEPLPAESGLWDHPNVIVTPHSSGATYRTARLTDELFVENFRAFLAGEPLPNEIGERPSR